MPFFSSVSSVSSPFNHTSIHSHMLTWIFCSHTGPLGAFPCGAHPDHPFNQWDRRTAHMINVILGIMLSIIFAPQSERTEFAKSLCVVAILIVLCRGAFGTMMTVLRIRVRD